MANLLYVRDVRMTKRRLNLDTGYIPSLNTGHPTSKKEMAMFVELVYDKRNVEGLRLSLHSGVLLPDGKFQGATKIAIGQHNRVAFSDNNAICAQAFSALFPLNFVIISEPALVIITRA